MKLILLAAAFAATLSAAPQLFYSKYFKGSVPEYTAITVQRDGQTIYQEAKDDDNPIRIQLKTATTQAMFDLANKLEHFQHPIESGLKVANTGAKTFRYEDGPERHEVEFNYSQDPNAQALLDWFERISETEQRFEDLDRTAHFYKLDVNGALLQLQESMEHNRLVDPEQFLPLLNRIAKNDSYLHIDQERAASIADAIRNPAPAGPEKTQ